MFHYCKPSNTVVLNQAHLEDCCNTDHHTPHPVLGFFFLFNGPENFNTFQSDDDVTGPLTTLWEPLWRCIFDSWRKDTVFTISLKCLTKGHLKFRVLSDFRLCWPSSPKLSMNYKLVYTHCKRDIWAETYLKHK